MNIVCWNLQWHRATSWQGAELRKRILKAIPEIVCCPEGHEDFLAGDFHGVFSRPDTGYRIVPGRRKVTLWSRQQWEEVDDLGSVDLPTGRFVRGLTVTSLGPLQVIGICVPWDAAHVSGGRCDRQRWEEHMLFLRTLRAILCTKKTEVPTILLGDFNQCLPRGRAPLKAYEELVHALEGLSIWTRGKIDALDRLPVCHIGGSAHFSVANVRGLPRMFHGKEISDHDGLAVELA